MSVIFRLTFQFSPSSKVYGVSEVDLTFNGGEKVCCVVCVMLVTKRVTKNISWNCSPRKRPIEPFGRIA